MSSGMVRYECPKCGKRLKSFASDAGNFATCTRCAVEMEIPAPPLALAVNDPEALPAPRKKGTVPLKLSLPKVGGMETTVSQGTANSMAKVATGGFLVALGIIVAALFGIRPPRA